MHDRLQMNTSLLALGSLTTRHIQVATGVGLCNVPVGPTFGDVHVALSCVPEVGRFSSGYFNKLLVAVTRLPLPKGEDDDPYEAVTHA